AIMRELGMVTARFDGTYLEACRVLLHDELIDGQAGYHRANAERLERVDRGLRWLGLATFVGLVAVLVALFFRHSGWLALAEAVLPALGGALAAIRGQAE